MAAELIAATANVKLLGTRPSACTYNNGGTTTNFPANLVPQARLAAIGEDVTACLAMTDLLRKFNSSGMTNDFPLGYYECSAGRNSALKKLSHDPTTKLNCPGKNDQCETAEAVVLTLDPKTLKTTPFKRTINTTGFFPSTVSSGTSTNSTTSSNAVSGAWYKITTDVGSHDRWFTANTAGSNFDTLLTVWQGTCGSLSTVTNNDNNGVSLQSLVKFQTDGVNTFFIVVGSGNGGYGRANIKVTSP